MKKNRMIFLSAFILSGLLAGLAPAHAQQGLEVSGIMTGEGEPVAVVNGKVVRVGDEIGGFRVTIIKDDFVAFLTPEGEPLDVWLRPIKNEASSVQQDPAPEAEKQQGLWERFVSLFNRGEKSAEEKDGVQQKGSFFSYIFGAMNARRRADEAAMEERRRIEEMITSGGGAPQSSDYDKNAMDMNTQILEARRILYQADAFKERSITAQFFQEKIALYDEAERKLRDVFSKTLDAQRRKDVTEMMEDIRDKKMALYREKKEFDQNIQEAVRARKLLIGMTKADVKNAIGLPDTIGKESRGRSLLESWTYKERFGVTAAEIYFEGDILVDARNK